MVYALFEKLRTGASIYRKLSFKDGEFLADNSSSNDPSKPGKIFQNVRSLRIDVSKLLGEHKDTEIIEMAYGYAQKVLALLSAKTGSYAYFEKPVTSIFNGAKYILFDGAFELYDNWGKTHFVHGGDAFLDNLDFLDSKKELSPILHCFRASIDYTNPIDYRILQLWRFFEGWFHLRGGNLVNTIIKIGEYRIFHAWDMNHKPVYRTKSISKDLVKNFYESYRNAVAHASSKKKGEVIYPYLLDLDTYYFEEFEEMTDIAKYILRKNKDIKKLFSD